MKNYTIVTVINFPAVIFYTGFIVGSVPARAPKRERLEPSLGWGLSNMWETGVTRLGGDKVWRVQYNKHVKF